jgi:hypothetical protein
VLEIDTIEQEHRGLVTAYTREAQPRFALNDCKDSTVFDDPVMLSMDDSMFCVNSAEGWPQFFQELHR